MEHITELRDLSAQKENQGTVGIFKLRKPLMVDGEKVTEIPYDFESMTVGNKLMATKNMMSAGYPSSNVEEFDPVYHLFLFAKAVEVATNERITTADILRMNARDGQVAGALARDFFYLLTED